MILYTILAILYLVTVVGAYKTCSKEFVVVRAFDTDPKLAMFCLILFSVFWPVVGVINNIAAVFENERV